MLSRVIRAPCQRGSIKDAGNLGTRLRRQPLTLEEGLSVTEKVPGIANLGREWACVSRETQANLHLQMGLLVGRRRQDAHDSIEVIDTCELNADLALAGPERDLHIGIKPV